MVSIVVEEEMESKKTQSANHPEKKAMENSLYQLNYDVKHGMYIPVIAKQMSDKQI